MNFISVGTHEQSLDRLFQALEELNGSEEMIVQSGYTRFPFQKCKADPFLTFQEIERLMCKARIVISHGGPATIVQARSKGKIPIVVPRQARFGEHVNDHQVDFTRRLEQEGLILAVYDISDLKGVLQNYESLTAALQKRQSQTPDTRAVLCKKLDDYCHQIEQSL